MTLTPNAVNAVDAESPSDVLMLPIEQVAKLLGDVSVRTVERMVKRNQFPPPRKLGRRSLWPRALVERWVNDPPTVTPTVAPLEEVAPVPEPMLLNDPKRTPPEEDTSTAPPVALGAASVPPTTETPPAPDHAAQRVVGEILAAVLDTRPNPTPAPTPNPPVPATVKPTPPPPTPPPAPPTPSRLPSPPVVRPVTVAPAATVPPVPRTHPGSAPNPAAVALSRLGTVPASVRPTVAPVPPRPAPPAPIPSGSVPNRPEPTRR